jgi:membrane associated rhomboid family serine protease
VAAVMLSAIMLEPTSTLRLPFFPLAIPGVVFGFAYVVYSVWHSWSSRDRINHDAHFSGALYGALVTWIWAPTKVALSIAVLRRYLGI